MMNAVKIIAKEQQFSCQDNGAISEARKGDGINKENHSGHEPQILLENRPSLSHFSSILA